MKQRTAFYVVAAIIFIFGLFLIIPNGIVGQSTEDSSQTGTITYQGVEGRTALELLKENHEVESAMYDFGEFVTSIDGQAADDTANFWAFYVNGAQASVGAGEYQTKPDDVIEWRLEAFQL